MLSIRPDWDELKKRFQSFWLRENETALMSVTYMRDNSAYRPAKPPVDSPDELYKWVLDPDRIYARNMARIENTFFGGEAFPVIASDFGTAGHAKYFKGAHYQFAGDTTWYFPYLEDGALPEYLGENSILSKELSCMKRLSEQGLDKFMVASPDNCGTIDALAHLRGSDNLLIDMLEDADWVRSCTHEIMQGYFDSSQKIYDVIRENNFGGSTHSWMQLWADGKMQQLQADLSVMISPQMYEEFVLPDLDEACNWLDYSVYHLDGQEQIRHLDMLLSIKKLNAIQWTHVAGQPIVTDFIPIFQRIQSAGKGLVIFPESLRQAKDLLENLKPKGLYLIVSSNNEAEAKDYLSLRK